MDKILDKIPYETLANFKPAHYYGMAAGAFLLIFGAMFFVGFSPNAEEKAKLDKQLAETEKKLQLYLAEGAQKEAMLAYANLEIQADACLGCDYCFLV